MAASVTGPRTWSGGRDKDGDYTYKVTHLVEAGVNDGPRTVLAAEGLPQPGDAWDFGEEGGPDLVVECGLEANATPLSQKDGEPFKQWLVEQTFSSKIDNPLRRPAEISGNYHKEKEEITEDRFGNPVVNSAWEPIRGPKAEFDTQRDSIKVKQWLADPQEQLVEDMMNTVNDLPLWGKPARTVKLSSRSFERHMIGSVEANLVNFYVRTLEFEYRKDGWDRDVLDEGTKVLFGEWNALTGEWVRKPVGGGVLNPDASGVHDPALPLNPDPENPAHFIKWTGGKGNSSRVILNGEGMPYTGGSQSVTYACTQCPSGAPFTWLLKGMSLGYDIELAYAGGCTWSSVVTPDGTFHLNYLPTKRWALIWTGTATVWSVDAKLWDCKGYNTLRKSQPTDAGPDFVQLARADVPGSIHLEGYRESDFTQLGIPIDLFNPF